MKDNKHYYKLSNYYKEKFGTKVFKVSLDIGCTCPNRDGTLSRGGCIFCTRTPHIGDKNKALKEQFNEIKEMIHKKWPIAKYIVYLEAGSNTYGDFDKLKQIYEEVITYDNVVGLNIGTRCDCITDKMYNYLEYLNKRTFLTIELGLQSCHNKTLNLINRHHTQEQFTECVKKLKKMNINVVAHIINGLPFETPQMMIDTAKYLNSILVDGIKIHMLYIENDSELGRRYQKKPFSILTKEEYIKIVSEQLKVLSKNIVIHRITGDPDRDKLIRPNWLIKKFVLLNDIDKFLRDNNIYQGDMVKDR